MTSTFEIADAAKQLEATLPDFLRDLESLVNIDSGTFDTAGVDQVGSFLEGRYRELGAQTSRTPLRPYGDAITAIFEGTGRSSVLLLGHTDTVYSEGTAAKRPFRIDGDRAFGPGSADMKAGDLAILYAVTELRRQGWDDFGRIEIVHNTDEEVGSPASRELIRRRAESADAVLVLEAGRENGDIVSARKGIANCQIEVVGRSAHAGVNHHLGRNAALELAHIVIALQGLNEHWPDVTVNVGRIEGGDRVNVVPGRASADVEIRAFDESHMREAIERTHAIVSRRMVKDTDAHVTIAIHHHPMERTEGTVRLLHAAQALSRLLGFELRDTATGGASDGNTAAAAGRPVLDGLGPIGGQAHSPDEYVFIPSIVPRIALLTGLVAACSGGLQDLKLLW